MPQGDATVRQWTDILGRVRFGSLPPDGRRKRSPLAINAVAQRLATYADADGSRVFPGLVRLAVTLEIEYETAKDAVAVLRDLGLIRLVRRGRGPGDSNEYQLCIPDTLLEHDDLYWSPGRLDAHVERIAAKKRGRYRAPHTASHAPRKPALRGPINPADAATVTEPAGSDAPRSPAPDPNLQGPVDPADEEPVLGPAGSTAPPPEAPAGRIVPDLRGPDTPATHHPPTTGATHQLTTKTSVRPSPSRAPREAAEPDPPPPTPERCKHGLTAARRADGQPACVLCRRGLPPSGPDVPDRAVARIRAPYRRRFAHPPTEPPPGPGRLAEVVPLRRPA